MHASTRPQRRRRSSLPSPRYPPLSPPPLLPAPFVFVFAAGDLRDGCSSVGLRACEKDVLAAGRTALTYRTVFILLEASVGLGATHGVILFPILLAPAACGMRSISRRWSGMAGRGEGSESLSRQRLEVASPRHNRKKWSTVRRGTG